MKYANDVEWFKAMPDHWYTGCRMNQLRVLKRDVVNSDYYIQKKTGRLVLREITETILVSPVDASVAEWYRDGLVHGFDFAIAKHNWGAEFHKEEQERIAKWNEAQEYLAGEPDDDD